VAACCASIIFWYSVGDWWVQESAVEALGAIGDAREAEPVQSFEG